MAQLTRQIFTRSFDTQQVYSPTECLLTECSFPLFCFQWRKWQYMQKSLQLPPLLLSRLAFKSTQGTPDHARRFYGQLRTAGAINTKKDGNQ